MSQDPAAKDNPRKFLDDPQQLNSYSYVRNNPLKFIDPDGLKLFIKGSEEFSVQAFASLASIYSGIYMDKNNSGHDVKIIGLNRIESWFAKDSQGLQLMKSIVDSDKKTTIIETDGVNTAKASNWESAANGEGSDSTIQYNPRGYRAMIDTYTPKDKSVSKSPRYPYIGLAHEMIHSSHISQGTVDFSRGDYKGLNKDSFNDVKEEIRTTGLGYGKKGDVTENNVRSENNFNLRNNY